MDGQLNLCLMAAELFRAPMETSLPFPQVSVGRSPSQLFSSVKLNVARATRGEGSCFCQLGSD